MILLICLVTFLVLFGSCINKTKQIHDVNKITFNNECVADLTDSFDCNYIALETNDETKNAQRKLERKNLDFIVLNSLNDQGAGFRCDTNKITIIDRQGATPYPLKSKQEVARDIIDRLVNNK